MRDNEKQIFTRREIDIDLKNSIKGILSFSGIFFALFLILSALGLCIMLEKNMMRFLFIIIEVVAISLMIVLGYFFVKGLVDFFAPTEYAIVSDFFVNESTKKVFLGGLSYFTFLNFKTYGKYSVDYGRSPASKTEGRTFYKWSPTCKTDTSGLLSYTKSGDEFYLIIVNNRIKYVYNKKIFEFKETNEKA